GSSCRGGRSRGSSCGRGSSSSSGSSCRRRTGRHWNTQHDAVRVVSNGKIESADGNRIALGKLAGQSRGGLNDGELLPGGRHKVIDEGAGQIVYARADIQGAGYV